MGQQHPHDANAPLVSSDPQRPPALRNQMTEGHFSFAAIHTKIGMRTFKRIT